MPLGAGARLGPYEILSAIGAGGMGEVYRATDTSLGRQVAIKVLPEAFAQDPDRLARFEREAKTLASLNHPNIAQIYGLERSGTAPALVMELVDGETLADRISRGPIPLDEALPIAKQIAEALEAAHEQGIIHRDLKPANIKLRPDGTVKVLDFGLAKLNDPNVPNGPNDPNALSLSPTITSPALMTGVGVLLGTAAYMAPEQAKGKPADKRSDIWAFGCVFYEMLTARRAFGGDDVTETLAAVVKDQPDLRDVPSTLHRLLRNCFERDPRRRLRNVGDAWALIDPTPSATSRGMSRLSYVPWAIAAVAITALVIVTAVSWRGIPPTAASVRFEVPWPAAASGDTGAAHFFQLSPDGRYVAIVAEGSLWVRSIDSLMSVRIDRTQGATYPFWSPDNKSIGFFADGKLKTVSRDGGAIHVLCAAINGRGGAWSPRGTIVFSDRSGVLSSVAEQGGTAAPVTKVRGTGSSEAHRYPQFLPDGDHFLYLYLSGSTDVAGIYVGALSGATPTRILDGLDNAVFAPSTTTNTSGYLLFRRQNTLMAQAFDAATLKLSGPVIAVATEVGQGENTGYGAFSVVAGALATGSGRAFRDRELLWIDRSGTRSTAVAPHLDIDDFSAAPDERRIAISVRNQDLGLDSDIWLQTSGSPSPVRFTFGPSPGWIFPVWSPQGDQVAYAGMDITGLSGYEIRRKPANMATADELLLRASNVIFLWDWSPDGKTLVYANANDLNLLPLDSGRKPTLFAHTAGEDQFAQFSPDGRWMAYASGDRGQMEVYVQPIPATGPLWQISRGGGTMPRWRRDGKELFYRGSDGRLMAVAVESAGRSDGAFAFSPAPEALFAVPASGNVNRFTYQPSRDGQRFLVSVPTTGAAPPITVVLNWPATLKQ